MKCSKCGGNVIQYCYAVYHEDGSTSGYYQCQKCGAKKDFYNNGFNNIINME